MRIRNANPDFRLRERRGLRRAPRDAYSGPMDDARILYQDGDCLAWNKLPGELAQGDRSGAPSLIDTLAPKADGAGRGARFIQPVHRLDRPASGVLIFALSKRFFTALTALFQERAVDKVYWAVVEHRPSSTGTVLKHHLAPDRRRNLVRVLPDREPNAILSWRLAGESDRYFFLEVRPDTGKQHQIRVQLAAAGMPIKGDVKYGARRGQPDRSILLHSREMRFRHPLTGAPVRLIAPPPPGALWDLFLRLAPDV
jgi:23S rRNA pseudouridine1911/1915/1917 synthase